jgi:UDP-glucose 4-epimerase
VTVLVTGGAGYIGAHTVLALQRAGHDVVVVDNLTRGSRAALDRVQELSGRPLRFHQLDLRDDAALRAVFAASDIEVVLHLASLKAVSESVRFPLRYYNNNIASTVSLCTVMDELGPRRLVFSSSAAVYGAGRAARFTEAARLAPVNPYGHTKVMIEQLLADLAATGRGWQITFLRCFNPVGADASGRIGEDPDGMPTNLLPMIVRAAVGQLPELVVFGTDYDTPDGTGIRDYLHVADLAEGHLAAMDHPPPADTAEAFNLGSGCGSTVLEVIAAFERASGLRVPWRAAARRPGDAPACWADPSKAARELGWAARRSLLDACADAWRWQCDNPAGYGPRPA